MSSDIDNAILAAVQKSWRKVAFIIVRVREDLSGAATYEEVAERIRALADEGQIESQGNLLKWRYSEIRQPRGD